MANNFGEIGLMSEYISAKWNISNYSYFEKKPGTRASCYLDGNNCGKNKVQFSSLSDF